MQIQLPKVKAEEEFHEKELCKNTYSYLLQNFYEVHERAQVLNTRQATKSQLINH